MKLRDNLLRVPRFRTRSPPESEVSLKPLACLNSLSSLWCKKASGFRIALTCQRPTVFPHLLVHCKAPEGRYVSSCNSGIFFFPTAPAGRHVVVFHMPPRWGYSYNILFLLFSTNISPRWGFRMPLWVRRSPEASEWEKGKRGQSAPLH